MPFTANRQFKSNPRSLAGEQGDVLHDDDGRESSMAYQVVVA